MSLDLEKDRWRSVNGTYGVVRLIMRGEAPVPAPYGFVERLQNNISGGLLPADFDALTVGDQVRLLTGPLAGQVAPVSQLDDAGRVRLLLSIMGGSTRVWAEREAVERVS